MDEVEAVERMPLVLDAAIHMRATGLAGMPLDCRRSIDDVKLVTIFEHLHIVARDDGDDGEGRPVGFPAFGAAAGVVVGDIAYDADLDWLALAFTDEGPACKAARTLLDAIVDRWVVELSWDRSFLCLTC